MMNLSGMETEVRRGGRLARDEYPWRAFLPAEWRSMVSAPLAFRHYEEPELEALRVFGEDEDGAACYYAHRYLIRDLRSDDGEEFYLAPAYGESITAWRLRDGRWLVHRVVSVGEEVGAGQGFYSFSESMPG